MATTEFIESEAAARVRRRAALFAVGLLVISNVMSNRILPAWAYLPWNVTVAVALIFIARHAGFGFGQVGLAFRHWHRPVGVGLLLVATTGLVLAVGMILPGTRDAFLDQRVAGTSVWMMLFQVLIRIPFGTVFLEEIAFRGVLPTLFGGNPAVSWKWKPVLASSFLFGLWHVLPSSALTNGNSAVAEMLGGSAVLTALLAVVSTMVVGVLLCLATYVGRGLKASLLVHWATNSLGFVAAWLIANS